MPTSYTQTNATCGTWDSWCDTGTATTTCSNDVWVHWNTGTSATTDTTWTTWNAATVVMDSTPARTQIQPSQAQVERLRVAEHARLQREADTKRAKKDLVAARKRAMKLLLTNLNKKQKEQFAKHKFFVIQGGKSKRKYRIRSNESKTNLPMANIDVLQHDNDNSVDYRICFHLSYDIPLGDQLLAQKLMLESDEDRAIKVSNRHAA